MSHPVVSKEEWLAARRDLLVKEKELTRARDRLNEARRALPWEPVAEDYVFDAPSGPKSLSELFGKCSQLIVYHFMLAPDWEEGCTGCSFLADHIDGAVIHLKHADANFVAVSRAPLEKIEAYKKRMGWKFPWVSSNGNEFNFDYRVSFRDEDIASGTITYNYRDMPAEEGLNEMPGFSIFVKGEDGKIYHSYSTYARGAEETLGTMMMLDLVPKGRNEEEIMDWVRRHDQYEDQPKAAAACCH
ncbi:thioredoxin family protein [Rhizobium sp. RM]|uniref:DUF899 domain-containing protein n=1 Tax=Rhizobium sp. RM TaxID=2748079 RepID=UPI00110D9D1B|nr:thioredoxin family protein [Rhizobium sp. RM]NWJ25137.1 thioredoxin family protein [Rhizobium sp. RM]TMV16902.1 DUF899 domain-containing protein [Rhizobium sp. Td3]